MKVLQVKIEITLESVQKGCDHRSCDDYNDINEEVLELMHKQFSDEFEKITVGSECVQEFDGDDEK